MADFPVYLKLMVGATKPTSPAPKKLMEALVEAEVSQGDQAPSGFQLIFASALDPATNDFDLLGHANLKTFARTALVAIVGDKETVLIDGYITNSELDPISGRVTVTGEDVSVKMDLFEMVIEYEKQKDSAIVKDILGKYSVLGLTPKVKPPQSEMAPVARTPVQRYTDREYLVRLAQKNDAQFFIQPGDSPGQNTAYWGPPLRKGPRQRAIAPRSGPVFGTLESLSMSQDALKTELNYGEKMADGNGGKEGKEVKYAADKFEDVPLAKVPPEIGKFASLATSPDKARAKIAQLSVKGKYINQLGLNSTAADNTAQARTDRSTGSGVTLTGTIDTVNYGSVLVAPGMVGVRAAGGSVSGDYYVQKVKHSFKFRRSEMRYTQSFTLVREGLGSKKTTVQ